MSDDEVIPDDGIVRTALQLLPVPPHADGFWTTLGSALDAEEPVGPAGLTAVPNESSAGDLAVVPVAFRRPANALLLAVAAAAAVVVAIAGTTLLDDEDGGDVASPPAEVAVTDAGPDLATPVTVSADDEDAATDAVLAWVDQVHEGASTEAWEAMGPTSQQHYGSEQAFAEEMAALSSTYAAWGGSAPEQVLITAVPGGDASLAVVTLVGTVTVDGALQTRADAFPVRLGDDGVQIEPAAGSSLEVVAPIASEDLTVAATLDDDDEIVVVVPEGSGAPVLRIDDGAPVVCGQSDDTVLTVLEDAPGRRCGYRPEAGVEAGDHTLTVAYRGDDGGAITARSVVFEAA